MRHLVLLGGGHAHLHVLRALARQAVPGVRVTLVSPFSHLVYSGMLPGLVAGHYAHSDCAIPLDLLAADAGADWDEAAALGMDAQHRRIYLSSGDELGYDVLSIDVGSVMDRNTIAGAREHGFFVRPIERFASKLDSLLLLANKQALSLVVVGGGAAGTEIALALQHRLGARSRVSLVTGGAPPLSSYPTPVQQLARQLLRRGNISVFEDACVEVAADRVTFGSGMRLACDAPVLAINGCAPSWLLGSGLLLDDNGYVAVSATLQSSSHPEVFAAGDVASRIDEPRPKSGVYAVRAGPPLARNLRRFMMGSPLQAYLPQQRSLNLLSCGGRRAIVSWGSFAAAGAWAWYLKNHIDRRFVARFSKTSKVARVELDVQQ